MGYIIYFAITIGILVFIHELGHFLAAKASGMRADVFAIGYGKRLLGYNKITGFTFGSLPDDFDGQGHTDYRISLLPLGGYVKIAGMVDESFDTAFAGQEPKPYEFRSKPAYKKLFVISAGVLMNFLLTIVILWGINYFVGDRIIATTEIGQVSESSVAEKLGFQNGDKIVSINGEKVDNWNDIVNTMVLDNLGQDVETKVDRNGESVNIHIPHDIISQSLQQGFFLSYSPARTCVGSVMENSPAETAGLKSGDIFLTINGQQIDTPQDVIDVVSANQGKDIPLTMLSNEDTVTTTASVGYDGKIGISLASMYTGQIDHKTYGFFASFTQSFADLEQIIDQTYSALKTVIAGDLEYDQVFGGPIKIAMYAEQSASSGLLNFLKFLAILSFNLAVVNFLPFPVLDGGHFVIILIERIRGRELPLKVKIAVQNFGFVILLMLVAFTIYSDIISL